MNIDLQGWIITLENNNFGIRFDSFFIRFVDSYFRTILNSGVPKELTQSYQDLKLSISLLKFLQLDNKVLLEKLEKILSENFPPILLLMNLNGTLIHRTDKRVDFIKMKDANEEQDKFHVERHGDLKPFKNKMHWHYFRNSHMEFLELVMRHPRVNLAFNSSIARRNIMPILDRMFIQSNKADLFGDHMFGLFDQNFSKEAPEITGEKYGRIRDPSKIWESDLV